MKSSIQIWNLNFPYSESYISEKGKVIPGKSDLVKAKGSTQSVW